uniref:Uncharacterized protein n=1 Tax=Cacopsylla melanoneura TaxID=428564 RepID=A0A8D8XYX4_9HEMI
MCCISVYKSKLKCMLTVPVRNINSKGGGGGRKGPPRLTRSIFFSPYFHKLILFNDNNVKNIYLPTYNRYRRFSQPFAFSEDGSPLPYWVCSRVGFYPSAPFPPQLPYYQCLSCLYYFIISFSMAVSSSAALVSKRNDWD